MLAAELDTATTILPQLAIHKAEPFFERCGYMSASDFLKWYGRLSGAVLHQADENSILAEPALAPQGACSHRQCDSAVGETLTANGLSNRGLDEGDTKLSAACRCYQTSEVSKTSEVCNRKFIMRFV